MLHLPAQAQKGVRRRCPLGGGRRRGGEVAGFRAGRRPLRLIPQEQGSGVKETFSHQLPVPRLRWVGSRGRDKRISVGTDIAAKGSRVSVWGGGLLGVGAPRRGQQGSEQTAPGLSCSSCLLQLCPGTSWSNSNNFYSKLLSLHLAHATCAPSQAPRSTWRSPAGSS